MFRPDSDFAIFELSEIAGCPEGLVEIGPSLAIIRRIGTRVLIPVSELRRFSRSDHPERLVG